MTLQAELRSFHGAVSTLLEALEGSVLREPPAAQHVPTSDRPRMVEAITSGISRLREAPDPPIGRADVARLAFHFAVLSEDSGNAAELARELEELGKPIELAPAVAFAEAGDIERALASVTARSEFISVRQRVDLLEEASQSARALELAHAGVTQWPGRAALEFAYARLLAPTDPKGAVPHARAAFADMPGRGQRELLVRCLLASGDFDEAWTLLAQMGDEPRIMKLRAVAAENAQPSRALELWNRYLATSPHDFSAQLRLAGVLARFGRAREAADAAWRAFQISEGQHPTIEQLRGIGLLQFPVEPGARDSRLREVLRRLAGLFHGIPEAEGAYLELWTRVREPADLTGPDFNLLASSGLASAVPVEQIIEMVANAAKRAEQARTAYDGGALSFESLCSVQGLRASQVLAQLLSAGKGVAFFPDITPPDVDVLEGKRFLVGELELLLFADLGLLDLLRVALGSSGQVVIFEDVERQLLAIPDSDEVERAAADKRRAALVAGFAAQVELPSAKGDCVDVEEAIAAGALYVIAAGEDEPTAPSSAWTKLGSPGADPLRRPFFETQEPTSYFLSLPALIQLGEQDALRRFLRAGGRWRLGPRATAELAAWLRGAQAREELETAAADVRRWCGAMREAGRLQSLPRPEVTMLPPMRNSGDEATRGLVQQSLSYREALAQDASLWLVVADFAVAETFQALAVHPIFLAFSWSADTYPALSQRLGATHSRTMDFGNVLRRVASPDSREDLLLKALSLGLADAMAGQDLVAFARRSGVNGFHFASVLRAAVVAGGPRSMPRGSLSQLCLARQWAHGLWSASKEDFPETADLVRAFFDAARSAGGLGDGVMLESLLDFLLAQVAESPRDSLVQAPGSTSWVLSPETRAGRLWTAVSQWLRAQPLAVWAFTQAMVKTVLQLDEVGVNDVRLAPLLLAVDCVSHAGGFATEAIDAAIAILSFRWEVKSAKRALVAFEDVEQRFEIRGEDALASAVGEVVAHGTRLRRHGRSLLVAMDVGGREIRVPVAPEAVLVRLPVDARAEFAHVVGAMLGPLDGGVSLALAKFTDGGTQQSDLADFAREAVRSPWRVVANHPEVLLDWAQPRGFGDAFPHDLQALLRLLSEVEQLPNEDLISILNERAQTGAWSTRLDRWGLLSQATAMPGSIGGMLAASRLTEENFNDEVGAAYRRLQSPNDQTVGWLTCDLITLQVAAQASPTREVRKGLTASRAFPAAVETVLTSVRTAPPAQSFADAEPTLLRLCVRIVEQVASRTRLSIRDGMWLAYRLFQWLTTVVSIEGCIRLAAAQVDHQRVLPAVNDVLDPIRFGHDRFRYRAASVLHALHQGSAMAHMRSPDAGGDGKSPSFLPRTALFTKGTWSILQELALAPVTREEEQLRAMERVKPDLGWALVLAAVPDLALMMLVDGRPSPKLVLSPQVITTWCNRLSAGDFDALPRDVSQALVETVLRSLLHGKRRPRRELLPIAAAVERIASSKWEPEHHVLARVCLAAAHAPNPLRDIGELLSRVDDEEALRRALRIALRALPKDKVVSHVRKYAKALRLKHSVVRAEVAAMATRVSRSTRPQWETALRHVEQMQQVK